MVKFLLEKRDLLVQNLFADLLLNHSQSIAVQVRCSVIFHVDRASNIVTVRSAKTAFLISQLKVVRYRSIRAFYAKSLVVINVQFSTQFN